MGSKARLVILTKKIPFRTAETVLNWQYFRRVYLGASFCLCKKLFSEKAGKVMDKIRRMHYNTNMNLFHKFETNGGKKWI